MVIDLVRWGIYEPDRDGEMVAVSKIAGSTFVDEFEDACFMIKYNGFENVKVKLKRDPDNKYDENAVRVVVSIDSIDNDDVFEYFVGHIPKEGAKILAPLMDSADYEIYADMYDLVGHTWQCEQCYNLVDLDKKICPTCGENTEPRKTFDNYGMRIIVGVEPEDASKDET